VGVVDVRRTVGAGKHANLFDDLIFDFGQGSGLLKVYAFLLSGTFEPLKMALLIVSRLALRNSKRSGQIVSDNSH
jgi:hypothetical protein